MVVLDEPYASDQLLAWLASSQHPVLDNGFARAAAAASGRALNLVAPDEAARRIDAGERVYTNSENALAWVVGHTRNEGLAGAIALFKDKAAMRRALAPLCEGLFFRTCAADGLATLDFAELEEHLPFVLKPSVGFCSVGVYRIGSRADWDAALADIARNAAAWQRRYPHSVVGAGEFILEGYLTGTEYAVDAYFDEEGRAHVLNVLRHDFAGAQDTSDRLYTTSPRIVREQAPVLAAWLDRVNAVVGARSFPVHAEVRIDGGVIRPIEFNPLRFAGLGGTDVAEHAFGFRTYEAFLTGAEVDFERAFSGREGKVYTMSLLNPPAGVVGDEGFDYEAFARRFSRVLELRRFDVARLGCYGFLFIETDEQDPSELDFLLHTDLREFIGPRAAQG